MTTFLEETLNAIHAHDLTSADIIYIGSRDFKYACTWDEFKLLADHEYRKDCEYDEVTLDLIIIFYDGRGLWREMFSDGSHWCFSDLVGTRDKLTSVMIKRTVLH